MLTSSIKFIEFKIKKKNKIIKKQLKILLKENNQIIRSLTNKYNNSFNSKSLLKFKKIKNYRIIGMGGSTLGSQAIYDFLKHKIKKK